MAPPSWRYRRTPTGTWRRRRGGDRQAATPRGAPQAGRFARAPHRRTSREARGRELPLQLRSGYARDSSRGRPSPVHGHPPGRSERLQSVRRAIGPLHMRVPVSSHAGTAPPTEVSLRQAVVAPIGRGGVGRCLPRQAQGQSLRRGLRMPSSGSRRSVPNRRGTPPWQDLQDITPRFGQDAHNFCVVTTLIRQMLIWGLVQLVRDETCRRSCPIWDCQAFSERRSRE
ncbi:hypothetical protein ACVWW1_008617 [Bradyrhizobium sp. JR3.5]